MQRLTPHFNEILVEYNDIETSIHYCSYSKIETIKKLLIYSLKLPPRF